MNELNTQQQVIDAFERLVSTPRSMKAKIEAKQADNLLAASNNPYRLKGLQHQAKKTGETSTLTPSVAKTDSHLEHAIHKMIVQHPFLLHTPELFSGGLYLDSVLNKHHLPCTLIPDFTYITVQDRVIKITLVEIEQAVKGVFHHRASKQSTFRSETKAAIDQVRDWRKRMENDAMRQALLLNLSPLFQHYPVGIFDSNGGVSKLTQISLGYVLVVGSETISTQVQQQMVDDLYLQENILLMTYPMLVEQLKTKITTKNMLKVGPKGVDALTIGAPDQLLSKGPDVGLPRLPDNDPFGIKMAGLGRALHASRSARSVGHPESFKRVFYRSEGRCEHAGCLDQVIQNGVFSGHLAHIYNNIGNDSKPETYSHIEFVGLFCSEHVKNLNNGHRYTLGQYHPLNVALAQRKAYRPALDAAASICSDSWPSNASKQILEVLCIDADLEPQLAQDVHQWSTAVISLPDSCQWLLHRIVREYFTPPCSRSRLDWNRIDYLRRAGVISVTAVDPTTNLVAPKVFSQPFIDRVRNTFRDRTPLAIEALCRANAYTLSQQLEYLAVDEAGASLC